MKTSHAMGFILILAVAAAGCGGDVTGEGSRTPTRLTAGGAVPAAAAAGSAVELSVRVADSRGGAVPGVQVQWRVVDGGGTVGAASASGEDGVARATWTLGQQAKLQSASAAVVGLSPVLFEVDGTPGPVATVAVSPTSGAIPVGGTVQLQASRADAFGNTVTGSGLVWTSSNAQVAAVSETGVVTGLSAGQAVVQATAGEPSAAATITVTVPATLVSIEPALLEPGVTATLTGTHFGATVGANVVRVAGVAATVVEATPTQLTVRVPDRAMLPCDATREVEVSVTAGGASATLRHPLAVADRRDVGVGEAIVGSAAEFACVELSRGGFVVSVFNAQPSPRRAAGFRASFVNAGAPPAVPAAAVRPVPAPVAAQAARILDVARERAALHREVLAKNHALQERLWPKRTRPAAASLRGAAVQEDPPQLGDTVAIRIPNLLGDLCQPKSVVSTRVVYSGSRAVLLEDRAAPLAGGMDDLYDSVGKEFDTVIYPLLLESFGDPLAFDANTDANGRVFIVYSKVVNDFGGGLLGFVSSGDFFSRGACAASNQAEIFYTVVPTSAADGFETGTRDYWRKLARGIMVHELKHVVSFAERFAGNAVGPEAPWLEEATAQLALEMWARTVFGYSAGANVDYRSSLYCEYRIQDACTGLPWAVGLGFEWLTDFYMAPETTGPIMDRDMQSFGQVYGSGWSFLRWIADTHLGGESDLIRSLVQEMSLSGVDNLVAKTGRKFADLVGEWLLATAVDDRPNFTPANARYQLPSWNTRSIYAGLYADFNSRIGWPPKPFPLAVRAVAPGTSTHDVGRVIGGGSAFFEVAGTDQAGPILGVAGSGGGAAASELRVSVIRVQ